VLAAAERLFAARGYESATIEDIAREAGVSRGTPSYFFGSKRSLYEAVLAEALARARRAVKPAIDAVRARGADERDVLAAAVDGIVDFVIDDPHFARLVQWEALNGHRSRAD
jgi:AcrR family transcriptional regulator